METVSKQINENEVKARKFLKYISDNLPRLKKALIKNVTYNSELFDDVIQESILKIYNSILKNGTNINDYEQYFFIVSKFTYIYFDNRKKKNDAIEVRDLFTNGEFDLCDESENKEERFEGALTVISQIKRNLIDEFGENKTNVYMSYMERRAIGRTSYKAMAKEYNLSVREISSIINEIKNYIATSESINKIKKEYKEI